MPYIHQSACQPKQLHCTARATEWVSHAALRTCTILAATSTMQHTALLANALASFHIHIFVQADHSTGCFSQQSG